MQQDAMLATRCTATQPDNQAAGAQFARMTILSGQKFGPGKNCGGNQGLLPRFAHPPLAATKTG